MAVAGVMLEQRRWKGTSRSARGIQGSARMCGRRWRTQNAPIAYEQSSFVGLWEAVAGRLGSRFAIFGRSQMRSVVGVVDHADGARACHLGGTRVLRPSRSGSASTSGCPCPRSSCSADSPPCRIRSTAPACIRRDLSPTADERGHRSASGYNSLQTSRPGEGIGLLQLSGLNRLPGRWI